MQGKFFLVFAPATEGSGRGARLVFVQIVLVKSSDFVQETQLVIILKNKHMNKLGANFSIFILFFKTTLIEAFQKHNWLEAALFLSLSLGVMPLWADLRKS